MKVKITRPEMLQYVPEYATEGSAGIDLRAVLSETLYLLPGQTAKVSTGIAVHIDRPCYAGIVLPRSGLGSKGLVLGNTVGLIDSDYQGEIFLTLWNRSNELIKVEPMDRVAQLVIIHIEHDVLELVYDFNVKTQRGEGGFGSTGS